VTRPKNPVVRVDRDALEAACAHLGGVPPRQAVETALARLVEPFPATERHQERVEDAWAACTRPKPQNATTGLLGPKEGHHER
jgi:hypothetical protein